MREPFIVELSAADISTVDQVNVEVHEASTAQQVAQLRHRWAHERLAAVAPCSDAFTAEVAQWMSASARTVWVADAAGRAIGMVCLTEYERMPSPLPRAAGRWGYLGHLYVLAEQRGNGVGRTLIATVLQAAEERGYTKVVLSPTPSSIPLYTRCGFTRENDLMVRQMT